MDLEFEIIEDTPSETGYYTFMIDYLSHTNLGMSFDDLQDLIGSVFGSLSWCM